MSMDKTMYYVVVKVYKKQQKMHVGNLIVNGVKLMVIKKLFVYLLKQINVTKKEDIHIQKQINVFLQIKKVMTFL